MGHLIFHHQLINEISKPCHYSFADYGTSLVGIYHKLGNNSVYNESSGSLPLLEWQAYQILLVYLKHSLGYVVQILKNAKVEHGT